MLNPGRNRTVETIFLLLAAVVISSSVYAETIVDWDFTRATYGWQGNARVSQMRVTDEGL